MCGIVSEQILKDMMRGHLALRINDRIAAVPTAALDEIEEFDLYRLVRFLEKAGLLDQPTRKTVVQLIELRNDYAHATGTNPEADALRAIELFRPIVEATVSLLAELDPGPVQYGRACDRVPNATGRFGHDVTSPVPAYPWLILSATSVPQWPSVFVPSHGKRGLRIPDGQLSTVRSLYASVKRSGLSCISICTTDRTRASPRRVSASARPKAAR